MRVILHRKSILVSLELELKHFLPFISYCFTPIFLVFAEMAFFTISK